MDKRNRNAIVSFPVLYCHGFIIWFIIEIAKKSQKGKRCRERSSGKVTRAQKRVGPLLSVCYIFSVFGHISE